MVAHLLKGLERAVIAVLIAMMAMVIVAGTVELGYIVGKDLITPPIFLLEIDELLEIFGFFLLILIGIELLETTKAYLVEGVVHVEIVLEVAIIAVGRKAIILDIKEVPAVTLLAIAGLITGLGVANYLVKASRQLKAKAG